MATSWGYEVMLAGLYKLLGLRAIPALLMCLKTALALVTFLLAQGFRGRFWPAVALSTIAQYIFAAAQPTPVYFSILFVGLELYVLFESRASHSARPLFWLPLLFFAWANLDDQFGYGIALLFIFVLVTWVEELVRRGGSKIAPRAFIMLVISGTGTVITPYFYRGYEAFFTQASSAANPYMPDFSALGFRQARDYALLLLFMSAFVALGMRRSRNPFQIALLLGCAAFSFHSQRDAWLVVIAAVAVIGDAIPESPKEAGFKVLNLYRPATVCIVIAILAIAMLAGIPRNENVLLAKAAENYPVLACNFIRQNRLPQPIFNNYQWGGFLTWYLPQYPVAVDSRNDLYGDEVIIQYFRVMNADEPYIAFPEMAQAKTLLLQKKSIMADAMSTVPSYRIAYSDDVSMVLSKRE